VEDTDASLTDLYEFLRILNDIAMLQADRSMSDNLKICLLDEDMLNLYESLLKRGS
jgi:hypothetical protein